MAVECMNTRVSCNGSHDVDMPAITNSRKRARRGSANAMYKIPTSSSSAKDCSSQPTVVTLTAKCEHKGAFARRVSNISTLTPVLMFQEASAIQGSETTLCAEVQAQMHQHSTFVVGLWQRHVRIADSCLTALNKDSSTHKTHSHTCYTWQLLQTSHN